MTQAGPDIPGSDLIGEPTRRVILIGSTGLDGQLRRDPGIELVRANDGFNAIGELGQLPPMDTVVIVSQGGEPDGRTGTPGDLIEALRRVDPGVRVLRVDDGTRNGSALNGSGYDGLIAPDARAEDLDALLPYAGKPAAIHSGPDLQGEIPSPEVVVRPMAAMPAGKAMPGSGDRTLVEAMLGGRDLVGPALAILRSRLGHDDIEYRPQTPGDAEPVGCAAPVLAGRRVLGHLVAGGVEQSTDDARALAGDLETAAAWLGSWLKLEIQQHDLRESAFTDPLTGAWNRRYFERYFAAALNEAKRGRLPITVMVFDIDNFKGYNDRFGHEAGDEILVESVKLLRSVIRPTDRVCRIGGDEFAVIFYEPGGPRSAESKPPESIFALATRFQKQVCAHRFPKLGQEAQGTLTISGGLATYPWDGTTPAKLLRRADELSLESKRSGKNVLTLGVGAERVCKVSFDQNEPRP